MGTVSVLMGTLQTYAWGRSNGLSTWLPSAPTGPHAELWFGAHPNGPSTVVEGPAIVSEHAPLLVKLLAAGSPLSIQVHPDAEGVETLQASPHTAQLLADSQVKSEVLIAVEEFAVLAGLRESADAHRVLSAGLSADCAALAALAEGNRVEAIRQIFAEQPGFDPQAALATLSPAERAVMELVVQKYPDDVGLPVSFMMKPNVVQPGDAMFVRAGCLHAYVDGFGVEVMTSSDNVLRLGLTPKQVAVEPALSILKPDLQPEVVSVSDNIAAVTGFPFSVQRISNGAASVSDAGAIVLCVEGDAHADCGAVVTAGQAAFLHDGQCTWQVRGTVYVARPTAGM